MNLRPTLVTRRRNPYSSLLLWPAPRQFDDALFALTQRRPSRYLAVPPPGSAMQPVRGDSGLPLLGHTINYIRFGPRLGRARYERFGPVSWMGAFGKKIVVIAGPSATHAALANTDKAFSQDGWTFLIDKFFHRGLMLMSFDEHLMHRRIMQQAFTRDRLTAYVGQVVPTCRTGVESWTTGEQVRLYPLLKELTLDIATDVFMGGRGGKDTQAINQAFVDTVRAASSIVRVPLPGTRYKAGVRGRKVLEDYFVRHLPQARTTGGGDLFAGLCHATTTEGDSFTDQDIVNHMIFLMMAAHDTSTIATAAAAYYLAKNPEWQRRARRESIALHTSGRPVDIDALEELVTLDLVIKESLRLVAPVPLVMRKAVKDTNVEGHFIPSGSLVAIAPAVNHFDTSYWTKPDQFDPDRFSPEREEHKSHRDAWIPFGSGVHKCIGLHFGTLEVKAILHQMLITYSWTVPPTYEVKWDNTSLPIPVDGLPIRFEILAA